MPESGNISGRRSQVRGRHCEAAVIRLLHSHCFVLLFQRLRTRAGEVDLILIRDDLVLLIEVKSLSQPWRVFERIGPAQLRRLQSNLVLLSGYKTKSPGGLTVRAFVAWVSPENRISFTEV